jgi:hypothetical protein
MYPRRTNINIYDRENAKKMLFALGHTWEAYARERSATIVKARRRELWKMKIAFAPRIDQISVIFFLVGGVTFHNATPASSSSDTQKFRVGQDMRNWYFLRCCCRRAKRSITQKDRRRICVVTNGNKWDGSGDAERR